MTIEPEKSIVPAQPQAMAEVFQNDFDVSTLLSTVGKLETTKQQQDILFAPIPREEVMIRPDGIVYMDWTFYAQRLTKAFPMKWALVPQGMPKINGDLIVWGFWLVIDGHLSGFAIGEQVRANSRMSYAECCEAAKSNALTRLCKGIGIGNELWHKPFIEKWITEFADTYKDERNRILWKKKQGVGGDLHSSAETELAEVVVGEIVEEGDSPRLITLSWNQKMVKADDKIGAKTAASPKFQIMFAGKFNHIEHFRNHIKKHFNVELAEELTWEQLQALYNHIEKLGDDPAYYIPEPPPISGWEGSMEVEKLYIDRGLGPLYNDLHQHLQTRLGGLEGKKVTKVLTNILTAVGIAYSDKPTDDEVKDMKDALDKELK